MRKHIPVTGSRYPTQSAMKVSARQRCLIAAALLFGLLLVLDAMPNLLAALSSFTGEKLLRFSAYATLSILIYAGLSGSSAARALITLSLAGIMRGVEEATQLMLPYHSANLLGWKFDMLAVLTCVGMLMMLHPVVSEWFASQQLRPARIPIRPTSIRQRDQRRSMQ
jgi:hypothetical protein